MDENGVKREMAAMKVRTVEVHGPKHFLKDAVDNHAQGKPIQECITSSYFRPKFTENMRKAAMLHSPNTTAAPILFKLLYATTTQAVAVLIPILQLLLIQYNTLTWNI